MARRLALVYIGLSPLPAVCLTAVLVYARTLEGWGVWALAPLFEAIAWTSLAMAAVGLALTRWMWRQPGLRLALAGTTVLAGGFGLWFAGALLDRML